MKKTSTYLKFLLLLAFWLCLGLSHEARACHKASPITENSETSGCGDVGHDHGHQNTDGFASIDLRTCKDGSLATWQGSGRITFRIDNVAGVAEDVIRAVRSGVLLWNRVQRVYELEEVSKARPDITVELFYQIFPGIIGATVVNCASGEDGIQTADVFLGVKGLAEPEIVNMTAHEVGHALGLGHSDKSQDLMHARLEEEDPVCPSNLDRQGLTAKRGPHSIPASDWAQLVCS